MIVKLTDLRGKTYGGTQWGEGVTHTILGGGNRLCSEDVIHYYEDEYLAVFANPIHCDFKEFLMWEFKPGKKIAGDTLKSGCKSGTTIRQVPIPKMTAEQYVEIAIRCAILVNKDDNWLKWAANWLDGTDRSINAANAAYAAAYAAANAAYVNVIQIIHKVMEANHES